MATEPNQRSATVGLKAQLFQDLKEAMKAKDDARKNAIRMVRAAIKNAEIEKQRELDQAEIQALINKEAKQRRESIEIFTKGDRPDLVEQEAAQLTVLEAYLPQQLGESEIAQIAQEVIAELGATSMADMGAVMREMMSKLRGQADGKLINKIVREQLG